MLPPDAVRKAAFKRKGPTIAIVIGGEAKHAPPEAKSDKKPMDDTQDEGQDEQDPCDECTCERCGNKYDPADAKPDATDEYPVMEKKPPQDERQAEEKA